MSDPIACLACREFYLAERAVLVAACATVGIEHNQPTGAMMRLYLDGYHAAGHDPDYAKRAAS